MKLLKMLIEQEIRQKLDELKLQDLINQKISIIIQHIMII
jgi:hypothetical protein